MDIPGHKQEIIIAAAKLYYVAFINVERYMAKKKEVCDYINTKDNINRIAEVGVLAGIGAYTLIKNTGAKMYNGYDNESYYGNVPTGYARRLLANEDWAFKLQNLNSSTTCDLHEKPFDLFHVDGDHSPMACFHDMILGHRSLRDEGWLLVDDYQNQMIQEAVDFWKQRYAKYIIEDKIFDGSTGNYLARVKLYAEKDGIW